MNTKQSLNITREEKVALIRKLQKNFHHKGELLLPDEELYPTNLTNKNISLCAKKICVWLGVKPHDLDFSVDKTKLPGYFRGEHKLINLSGEFAHNQYLGIALVSRYCLEYLFTRNKTPVDDELLELASIEFGLGLLTINTIDSGHDIGASFNRFVFRTRHPRIRKSILRYFAVKEYTSMFADYVDANDLDFQVTIEHVLPWAVKWLPDNLSSTKAKQNEWYVKEAKTLVKTNRVKMTGVLIATILLTTVGVFTWSNRPLSLSADLEAQKEKIEIFDKSYHVCMDSLRYKKQKFDENDIFMVRQIDAHLSRCISIRNNHDYLVKQYNQSIEKAGLD